NFDADRARVDVGLASPVRLTSVPSAPLFRNALHDVTIFHHYVVRGHFTEGRAQMLERELGLAHAGVLEDEHIGLAAALALAVVGRSLDLGDHTGVGMKFGHKSDHASIAAGIV